MAASFGVYHLFDLCKDVNEIRICLFIVITKCNEHKWV